MEGASRAFLTVRIRAERRDLAVRQRGEQQRASIRFAGKVSSHSIHVAIMMWQLLIKTGIRRGGARRRRGCLGLVMRLPSALPGRGVRLTKAASLITRGKPSTSGGRKSAGAWREDAPQLRVYVVLRGFPYSIF
jgi:hypothetical protein